MSKGREGALLDDKERQKTEMRGAISTTTMFGLFCLIYIVEWHGIGTNVIVNAFSAPVSPHKHSDKPSAFTIRVCENKHCAKQQKQSSAAAGNLKNSRPLAQMLQDLTHTPSANIITVEQSGCLSQCGKGPNISIIAHHRNHNKNKKKQQTQSGDQEQESLCHGIDNPMAAALALKDNIADYEVPKVLLAACAVMAQAVQGMWCVRSFLARRWGSLLQT
jgi:hypothetical protein